MLVLWAMWWKAVYWSGRTLQGSLLTAWSLCLFTCSGGWATDCWCLWSTLSPLSLVLGGSHSGGWETGFSRGHTQWISFCSVFLHESAFMIYTQTHVSLFLKGYTFQYSSYCSLYNLVILPVFSSLFWQCCTALHMLCKHATNRPLIICIFKEKLGLCYFWMELGDLWNHIILGKENGCVFLWAGVVWAVPVSIMTYWCHPPGRDPDNSDSVCKLIKSGFEMLAWF